MMIIITIIIIIIIIIIMIMIIIIMCDQARAIRKNGWLSQLELKQLKDK